MQPAQYFFRIIKRDSKKYERGELVATRGPLRRSRRNRMIAGVCGGLGEFFGINPFWFRLAFLIALIPGGVPGILAYVIVWLVVPGE
jgi:phage shock protein C